MSDGDTAARSPHLLPFLGDPPDRSSWVRAQETAFNPEHWRAHLGDDAFLPPEFDSLKRDKRGYRLISWQDVHGIAERANEPLGALHTYVAAAAWGSGKRPARPRRIFTGDRAQAWAVAEKLKAAADVLATDDPVAAYRVMDRGGTAYTPGLRAAFFTKFMYYAGYPNEPRECTGQRHPLILDSNVAIALNRLLNLGWRKSGWTADQYRRYLNIAHDWAGQWGDGCDPDVVERVLFSIGQSGSLAVAALTGLPPR
jgi:hypothetical protein